MIVFAMLGASRAALAQTPAPIPLQTALPMPAPQMPVLPTATVYRTDTSIATIMKVDTVLSRNDTLETFVTMQVRVRRVPVPPPPATTFFFSVRPALSLTQNAFQNWVEGGVSSVAWLAAASLNFDYTSPDIIWQSRAELNFGQTKLDTSYLKKTNDLIDLSSQVLFKIGSVFYPQALFKLRTQFAPGFDYATEPARQISGFFDPAYITQSVGMAYYKSDSLNFSVGIGLRQIVTREFAIYSDNPATPQPEYFNFTSGIDLNAVWLVGLLPQVSYRVHASAFSAFDRLNVWDYRIRNTLRFVINDFLATQLGFTLLYQDLASQRIQWQQNFLLTLSYNFKNF